MSRKIDLLGMMIVTVLAGTTAVTLFASDKDESAGHGAETASHAVETKAASEPVSVAGSSACLSDPSVFDDLKRRRQELDARAKALADKETELNARERALSEEIGKLTVIRDEISKADAGKKKEMEEKLTKLVETFETMSPKSAAQVMANLDEGLAVSAMERLSNQKLAKIMSSMESGKASRLTEVLAGVARAKKVRPLASFGDNSGTVATRQSAKGGERDDGHNENNASASGTDRSGSVDLGGAASQGQKPY